jgi:hypothetical protein
VPSDFPTNPDVLSYRLDLAKMETSAAQPVPAPVAGGGRTTPAGAAAPISGRGPADGRGPGAGQVGCVTVQVPPR